MLAVGLVLPTIKVQGLRCLMSGLVSETLQAGCALELRDFWVQNSHVYAATMRALHKPWATGENRNKDRNPVFRPEHGSDDGISKKVLEPLRRHAGTVPTL